METLQEAVTTNTGRPILRMNEVEMRNHLEENFSAFGVDRDEIEPGPIRTIAVNVNGRSLDDLGRASG